VTFHLDQATLTEENRQVVAQVAEYYRRGGTPRITVTGYTDTSGSAAHNRLPDRVLAPARRFRILVGIDDFTHKPLVPVPINLWWQSVIPRSLVFGSRPSWIGW
jgi:hypothetical protein